ncbi:Glycylpeptide N-tetradecanoyltransferase [Phytophthora nicotianae]|uniref:Glycylpeptide N-tetradecanoyltransferase n=1 Tax=Phytophthora nicotianae TaxID=4792 RepID=A0A0W8DLU0_PHYNI|nr:Glycylpeptide N-tetradecanoyltransferase [Phytophthora nicotianae]
MICIDNVGGRALLVGGVAAWLTAISTGKDWLTKDYLFVLAVVGVVLVGSFRKAKYERLALHEKLQRAHDLEKVEFIYGDPVQLEMNKVTCILFFESREELAMYEVKGRNASNFRELKEFAFSIGIETGFMSKEYLVRCDLFTVPQLFIVGKNKSIVWYGDPCAKAVEVRSICCLSIQCLIVSRGFHNMSDTNSCSY